MPHHVFIVEDHALMREIVEAYVTGQPALSVCGTASTGEEALGLLPCGADLVLVDISLPGMSGIDLIRTIRTRWPDLACLVCSGHDEAVYVERALAAGARGYVAKGNPAELADGLRCILSGIDYLSPSLRERVEARAAEAVDGGSRNVRSKRLIASEAGVFTRD